jgi:glycosyltransferase involved in cell wall biosynthesis
VAEVLVIDNNSSDRTLDVVQDAERNGPFPVRHFVERKQGLNFSRNRGASEAAFNHLIYFDDDMIVDEGWLEAYVDIRSRLRPDCVVGPVEPRFEEEPPDWMTSRIVRSVTSPYSRKGSQEMVLAPDVAHEIPGCNFGVLKSVVSEVGGFHPGLDRSGSGMLAGGDFEFGERIVELGKRVAYSPRCRIRHFISSRKISSAGLRARWKGVGATLRTLEHLRGTKITKKQKLRLLGSTIRSFLRGGLFWFQGEKGRALESELEGRRILAYLVVEPRDLPARDFTYFSGANPDKSRSTGGSPLGQTTAKAAVQE